jgi:hypothetical protein
MGPANRQPAAVRGVVMRRAKWRCEVCQQGGPLELHQAQAGELLALCADCHDAAHDAGVRSAPETDPKQLTFEPYFHPRK